MTAATVIKCLKDVFYTFGTPLYIHSDRGSVFLSAEFTDFLNSLGIACSRTTPYNPQGNGQVERLNGTLWKAIQLALRSNNLVIENWEQVLPMALHSIRSLLCTSINTTPHERLFKHPRRSTTGESLPTWLVPGPILMKKNVRNKNDPFVEEVELLQTNPHYSFIKRIDGRETTVSNRQLASLPILDERPISLAEEVDDHHIQIQERSNLNNPVVQVREQSCNDRLDQPSSTSSLESTLHSKDQGDTETGISEKSLKRSERIRRQSS